MEVAGGLGEVLRSEGKAGLCAEGGCGHDLHLLTGLSRHVHVHLIVGDGFEVKLVDVEVAGGDGVFRGNRDRDQLCGDAVGAEMLALVVAVERTGHVLGVLDVLRARRLLRAGHGEEQVARTGFANGGGGETVADVVVVDGVEVCAFEAEMQEADGGIALGGGIELDELAVVDLDEGLVWDVVFAEIEGLFEAELLVEGNGSGEVVDADGDVGDAVERRRGCVPGSCCRDGPVVRSFAVPLIPNSRG
jgi:hypothetical protein